MGLVQLHASRGAEVTGWRVHRNSMHGRSSDLEQQLTDLDLLPSSVLDCHPEAMLPAVSHGQQLYRVHMHAA